MIFSPWWIHIVLGFAAFLGLAMGLPALFRPLSGDRQFSALAEVVAVLFLGFFGILALRSAVFQVKRHHLVERCRDLDDLSALPWKDFEFLVGEAYRRKGFEVQQSVETGPQGAVAIVLRKGNAELLVQCKRWPGQDVPVGVVRELLAVVTDAKATSGIVITTGNFTHEAEQFASDHAIELVNGRALLNLLSDARTDGVGAQPAIADDSSSPLCPECHRPMVRRFARIDGRAGHQYWGCTGFPACTAMLPIDDRDEAASKV